MNERAVTLPCLCRLFLNVHTNNPEYEPQKVQRNEMDKAIVLREAGEYKMKYLSRVSHIYLHMQLSICMLVLIMLYNSQYALPNTTLTIYLAVHNNYDSIRIYADNTRGMYTRCDLMSSNVEQNRGTHATEI